MPPIRSTWPDATRGVHNLVMGWGKWFFLDQENRIITGLPSPASVEENGHLSMAQGGIGLMPIFVKMVACRSMMLTGSLKATSGHPLAFAPLT